MINKLEIMKAIPLKVLVLSMVALFFSTQYGNAQCDATNDIIQNTGGTSFGYSDFYFAFGNSFTPTCSGKLEGISFWTSNVTGGSIGGVSITVQLYRNPFSDSRVLISSETTDVPFSSSRTEQYVIFDDKPQLTAGIEYGYRILKNDSEYNVRPLHNSGNPYSGGKRLYNDFWSSSNIDMRFQIHYFDEVAPNANCRNITRALGANGTVSISGVNVNNNSSDADSGIASYFVSPSTFDCSNIGDNTVTLTVRDQNGNASTCQATVTITDDNPPVLTCPGDMTVYTDPGVPAVVNYGDIDYSDCSIETPSGYTFLGYWDSKYYFISNNTVQAGQAFAQAESLGGFAATITSQEQNDFIRTAANNAGYNVQIMIGYNDVSVENTFEWHSGSTATYTNWNLPNEPNNSGNEDYTVMRTDGLWNDIKSNATRNYILELSSAAITQTAGLASGSVFPVGTTTNTFEAMDGEGNTGTCSFTVTVVESPYETDVSLSGGTLTIADIETASDDSITLSNDGTTLTIGNLVNPVQVSAGVTLVDANTVTVPMASITNGIIVNANGGTDSVTLSDALTLGGSNNGFQVNDVESHTQTTDLIASGNITITSSGTISLTNATVRSTGGNVAISSNGNINGSGVVFIVANGTLSVNVLGGASSRLINTGNFIAQFTAGSGEFEIPETFLNGINTNLGVSAPDISIPNSVETTILSLTNRDEDTTFFGVATADATDGTFEITDADLANVTAGQIKVLSITVDSLSTMTIDSVNMGATDFELTNGSGGAAGPISFVGTSAFNDLTVFSSGGMSQTGPITINGNTTFQNVLPIANVNIVLDNGGNNFVGLIHVNTPGIGLTLTDANTLELGTVSVDQTTNITASTIQLSENTVFNKNGTGTATFSGDIDATSTGAANAATVNHYAGTLSFVGTTIDLTGKLDYNGVVDTTTNFSGTTNLSTEGISPFFGYLNVTGTFSLDVFTNILNEARFTGGATLLKGVGSLGGGPTIIETGATIAPGTIGNVRSISTNDLQISSGTFAPTVENDDDYDILEVAGTVTLTNATLSPTGGFTSSPSDFEIMLIDNDGTDPVNGTFNNLPEGSDISFGSYNGRISYVGGDGNDVTLLPPSETTVVLSNGKLTITDVNGGTSDDDITLSNDGTTLTISNLTSPVGISNDVTLLTANSVSVPISSITSGITFLGEGGNNTINFNSDLALAGTDNDITLNELSGYTQNGHINIGGDFNITNATGFNLTFGQLTANNLQVSGVNNIADQALALTISGTTQLTANNIIEIKNGQGRHSFTGEVTLNAGQVLNFEAGSDLTVGNFTTSNGGNLLNDLTVSPGNIILTGDVNIAGNSDLRLRTTGNITQPGGVITADRLELNSGPSNTSTAFFFNDNDVNQIATAGLSDLELIVFNDIDDIEIGSLSTNGMTLFATTIELSENTNFTKNGTGVVSLMGNIDVTASSATGTATINHNSGSIDFNGPTNDLGGRLAYNGASGSITNFYGTITNLPIGGPGVSVTFGYLNVLGSIWIGDSNISILNEARFIGSTTLVQGIGFVSGGPSTLFSGATLQPGGSTNTYSLKFADLEINGSTFAPLIESDTSYDSIEVSGTLTLTNATFSPIGGFTPQPDDNEIVLIYNDGTDAVVGTFNGYPEGSAVSLPGYGGIISYVGGDGNDVTIVPDFVDPVAVCQDITVNVIPGSDVTVSASDIDGGSSDNAGIAQLLIEGSSQIVFSFANIGSHDVTLTVIDGNGNSAQCTATITVASGITNTLPVLISEYEPENVNIIAPNPQMVEISGAAGELFGGYLIVIEGDRDSGEVGLVRSADFISGTFDSNGLLTVSIPKIVTPSHTLVLSDSFTGQVGVTDIDTGGEETRPADNIADLGNIFDAIGVVDENLDVGFTHGSDLGGVDMPNINDRPRLAFRDGSTGDFYIIGNGDNIYDVNGNVIAPSEFDQDPRAGSGTFGAINPRRVIKLRPKVYLQGAALNPNTGQELFMRDDLRVAGLLPTDSPYGDLSTDPSTFSDVEPNNNIVDWVWVELRDATDNTNIIVGRSALLQRDGDIVDTNGSGTLTFAQPSGNYYVAVHHRNHLSIMTDAPIGLSGVQTFVNFSDGSTPTFGNNAQTSYGMPSGIVAMWAGDANEDGQVIFLNTGAESVKIKQTVLDVSAAESPFGASVFYKPAGYYDEDINMDGEVIFLNAGNELLFIKDNVLAHPENAVFNSVFYVINAQMP